MAKKCIITDCRLTHGTVRKGHKCVITHIPLFLLNLKRMDEYGTSKRVWSENTTVTHYRPTHSTVRKSYKTPGGQTKKKAISSLFPIKMIAKLERTHSNVQKKHWTITEPDNGSNSQQRINNNRTPALEWTIPSLLFVWKSNIVRTSV